MLDREPHAAFVVDAHARRSFQIDRDAAYRHRTQPVGVHPERPGADALADRSRQKDERVHVRHACEIEDAVSFAAFARSALEHAPGKAKDVGAAIAGRFDGPADDGPLVPAVVQAIDQDSDALMRPGARQTPGRRLLARHEPVRPAASRTPQDPSYGTSAVGINEQAATDSYGEDSRGDEPRPTREAGATDQ
jgi:hypothetical protein